VNIRTAELIERLRPVSPMPADGSPELSLERLSVYERLMQETWQHVVEDGEMAEELLVPLINSFGYGDGFGLYWTTLHILEKYPLDRLRPALLEAVQNGERGSRMWSVYMLGIQRNPIDVPVFLRALKDPEYDVRYYALMALGAIGTRDAVPAMEELLADPAAKVRKAAREYTDRLTGTLGAAE
jgi:hypothetical protein